jgi:hypothetical protein
LYGLGHNDPIDNARFDWTFILFGNEDAADQETIARCNEVLRLNPAHKFVLRTWPILNLGDSPENSNQATMFHYLYAPHTKERLLAEVQRQISVMVHGLAKPESVVAATFLEELPANFTSDPFSQQWANWRKGDPLPWDIARFHREIEAEIGEPFDLTNDRHRLWWGRRYTEVITEIHRAMKAALGQRPVLYYQKAGYLAMDIAPTVLGDKRSSNVLPIRYGDLVGPGKADGIFGYPNSRNTWQVEAQAPADMLGCSLFSQISLPPTMRLGTLSEMIAMAKWVSPHNLGTFLFPTWGRKSHAWNELEYQNDSFWTSIDHIRRFGWERQIHMDIVRDGLPPVVAVSYERASVSEGTFYVRAVIWNQRDPSWYGGSTDLATLKAVSANIRTPENVGVTSEGNVTRYVGDIGPRDGRAVEWTVQTRPRSALAPADHFVVFAAAQDGSEGAGTSPSKPGFAGAGEERLIGRSGDRFLELDGSSPAAASVELLPLGPDIAFPRLRRDGDRDSITYRETLRHNTRLVMGRGSTVRLFANELFPTSVRQFYRRQGETGGAAEVKEGYLVFATPQVDVRSDERYQVSVTGWAHGGGNCQVVARFSGVQAGETFNADVPVLSDCFSDALSTAVSKELIVPRLDAGTAHMALLFYRARDRGSVSYRSFDCRRSDIPEAGLDVSAKVDGTLGASTGPFSVWTYEDQSDPLPDGRAKLRVRFLGDELTAGTGD